MSNDAAFEKGLVILTRPAKEDLSTYQYKWVKQDTDGTILHMDADTENPLGVLQNNPTTAGQAADVAIGGISIVIAGGAIDEGMSVGPTATGTAEDHTAVATKYIGGKAITACTGINEQIAVLLTPVPTKGHA